MNLLTFIQDNYLVLFTAAGLFSILIGKKQNSQFRSQNLWMTLVIVLALTVIDWLELVCKTDPALRQGRILFSVLGYSLRPACALGFIYLIIRDNKPRLYLMIPLVINLLIFMTAFFSPLTFYYDENYQFHRGPLGYTVFIVSFLYILYLLIITIQRFHDGLRGEGLLLTICAVACASSAILETMRHDNLLKPSILISCVFYYLFLYAQMADRDLITELRNSQSFQTDIRAFDHRITAAASVDMNGLKGINDQQGHAAGDRALAAIGRCMRRFKCSGMCPYRTGGDEFIFLYFGGSEEADLQLLKNVRLAIEAEGLSVAWGYARREAGESVDDMVKRSDRTMYENKAEYYKISGHDRRRG